VAELQKLQDDIPEATQNIGVAAVNLAMADFEKSLKTKAEKDLFEYIKTNPEGPAKGKSGQAAKALGPDEVIKNTPDFFDKYLISQLRNLNVPQPSRELILRAAGEVLEGQIKAGSRSISMEKEFLRAIEAGDSWTPIKIIISQLILQVTAWLFGEAVKDSIMIDVESFVEGTTDVQSYLQMSKSELTEYYTEVREKYPVR
jgi:hypothetical protein